MSPPAANCGDERGEAPSFGAIFREHGPFVWRLLRRIGVSDVDADDLCQEVFLVLYRRFAEIDISRPLRPWVYGVAIRLASEHRRKHARREGAPEDADTGAPAMQHEELERRQLRDLLDEAIARLGETKRAIFVLHELEELSMAEIAEALSCPVQTAYSRLHAARKEVQAFFLRLEARETVA
ncbi:MAG TPA: sigma-70 family RNA polymerase sigma factor [Polyangiaceae bacterium]|nr:sigma-70 family RNA polymerase sigma factor [Polyangiaceae bacterium]